MKTLNDFIKEKESLWETLKQEKRPVILYGMGDGAVKLIAILKTFGITPSGIFASDEFVRYNEFQGMTVKKLSDIEEEFDDFVILTAFASNRDDVCDRIFAIAQKHTLFVPDINVVRDSLEVFDSHFYEKNYKRLERVYEALDLFSKEVFVTLINYKLSGKIEYLKKLNELRLNENLPYDRQKIEYFADFGAYTGDTLKESFALYPNIKRAAGFEPDAKTFKKLEKTILSLPSCIDIFPMASHSQNCELELSEGAGRNTLLKEQVKENSSLQKKTERKVSAVRADSILNFTPDLIKLDVEGNEVNTLEGCRGFFERSRPIVRVSIYHNNRDLFEIYEKIEELKKGYKFTLSQKCRYIPAWDVELVAY